MPSIIIKFENPINVSCKIGDNVYAAQTLNSFPASPTTGLGNFSTAGINQLQKIGVCESVQHDFCSGCVIEEPHVGVDVDTTASFLPTTASGNYIFFSKNNQIHLSDLTGYYAEFEFRNNSPSKAELFSVGSEVAQSSK